MKCRIRVKLLMYFLGVAERPFHKHTCRHSAVVFVQAISQSNFWCGLWKLSVHLRCGNHGLDNLYLSKAEQVRKRSRALNWHQYLVWNRVCIFCFYCNDSPGCLLQVYSLIQFVFVLKYLNFATTRSLEHQLQEIRADEDEMLAGQRGSRVSKWIQHSKDVREKVGLSAPEKLQTLAFD